MRMPFDMLAKWLARSLRGPFTRIPNAQIAERDDERGK